MAIRMSGLTSGLDTEAIVSAMLMNYRAKTDKLKKSQTKLDWTRDAWSDVNKQVNALYSKISNLRYSSAYNVMKSTISDSTKATVSASSGAVLGTQSLKITQTAKAAYLTGGKLDSKTTGKTTMKELAGGSVKDGKITINKANGEAVNINVKDDMTVDEFVNELKTNGLTASYDSANQRIFVSAKESGEKNSFTLTASNSQGLNALKGLGLYVGTQTDDEGNVIKDQTYKTYEAYAAYNTVSADDIKASLQSIRKAQKEKTDVENQLKTLNNQKSYLESVKALDDAEGTAEQKEQLRNLLDAKYVKKNDDGSYTAYEKMEEVKEDGVTKLKYTRLDGTEEYLPDKLTDSVDDAIKDYAKSIGYITEKDGEEDTSKLDEFKKNYQAVKDFVKTSDWSSELDEGDKAEKIAAIEAEIALKETALNEANATLESADNKKLIDTFGIGDIQLLTDDDLTALVADYKSKAQVGAEYISGSVNGGTYPSASRVEAQDASIILNGVEYTSDTNNFSINGLTITALGTTGDDELSITTTTDTQGLYDKVKDILTDYNDLINNLMKQYNAESAKGYEPLSDDEKEAMSDKEIEKWEAKVKGALLRHDSKLNSVINLFTSSMSKAYDVTLKDGSTSKWSLGSLGIHTLGFLNSATNENYAYHIDGDEDDEKTAGSKDKLKAMITEDPDAVVDFLKQLSSGLYKELDKSMKSSSVSSAYTIYNDKQMDKEYKDYTTQIKEWEKRIAAKEEAYFKQFSAMEAALAKMQSSASSITGMMGGN